MKRPALFVFITLLVAFGSFAVAQENKDTPSQPPMRQQKIDMPGQGQGGGMQYTKKRKMMDQGMMGQSTMMDCSGCIVNRVLMGSSIFYLDMRKPLGLTDAQVDKLQQIRLDHAKQSIDLQGELDIARLELQDLLESDAIQINDADRKISDTYDLEAELQIKKVKSMIEAAGCFLRPPTPSSPMCRLTTSWRSMRRSRSTGGIRYNILLYYISLHETTFTGT